MPESSQALNTSKRKFYKLLDNISSSRANLPVEKNASSTTLAAEPPNKRFRVLNKDREDRPLTAPSSRARPISVAGERPASGIRTVRGITGIIGGRQRPKSYVAGESPKSGMGKEDGERKQLNYAPWSHEQFLARLKTFADVRTWTPKPPAIGEVEWAKRGWIVSGKDTVGCKGGCEKRIVVRLANDMNKNAASTENNDQSKDEDEDEDEESSWWMGDLERNMVEKYKDLIVEGHEEGCLWRNAGCKDDIYRIKMTDPAIWQWELRERYLTLLSIEDTLPERMELPHGSANPRARLDADEIAKLVPASVLERPQKEKENTEPETNSTSTKSTEQPSTVDANNESINKTALALAICGWTGQSPNSVQLAYCTKCFQRIGLWLYRSTSPSDAKSVTSLTTTEGNEPMVFDPIDLHREHCPWKNPDSQCALGSLAGLAGWQVLVSLIRGYKRHGQADAKRTVGATGASEGYDDQERSPGKTRAEIEKEDKNRRSRLQRLKRAFTVSSSKDKKKS